MCFNKYGTKIASDCKLVQRCDRSLKSQKFYLKKQGETYQLFKDFLYVGVSVLKIFGCLLICGIGYSLLQNSTLIEWANMRSSEYARIYGNTELTDLQWIIAVIGAIMNISGIGLAYKSLKSVLSKIKSANRQNSIQAKVIAVLLCIFVVYLAMIVFISVLDGGLKGVSIWDVLIICALFKAIWIGVVGLCKKEE
jgi:hypothetical protein